VPGRGVVLGRRPDCDVVLASPKASSVHAIVTPTLDGLELLVLGRNPTSVDGNRVQGRVLLRDGAVLVLPGGEFTVALGDTRAWSARPWTLLHPDGQRYALRRLPFALGGSARDHLQVPGWPDGAVEFHAAEGAVAAEFHAAGRLNETPLAAGAVELIEDEDRLQFGSAVVQVRSAGPRERTPTVLAGATGLTAVRFEFLPNGGRLTLQTDAQAQPLTLELPELRGRLIAALLSPPSSYEAGDLIPDDLLIPAIWTAHAERTRVDLNVLIYRTRKALLKAGINPARVVARARAGGATRIQLAPGARVEVV
jgi:hypothetical protein